MKKLVISFISLLASTNMVYGMVVFDPSVFAQTLATANNTLSQLNQLKNQLDVMRQQKKILDRQMLSLDGNQYQWSDAQHLINQLANTIQQNNALAYSASNADSQFKQLYPGYQAPDDYGDQYKRITNTTLTTLNNVLRSLGTNANDFQNENKRMAFLQQQEQSADNQLKAIQAASQIASEQVSQTQLLRQTIIAQTNAQNAYYASQVQTEASSRAELEKIIKNGAKTAPPIGHSGNYLTLPNF